MTVIIIIIAAALIIAAVIFVPKIINRKSADEILQDQSPNATVIKCNAAKYLTDSDYKNVEDIVRNIVGEKFKSVDKEAGFAPMYSLESAGYDSEDTAQMSEEEYSRAFADVIGDRLVVTCLLLTDDERIEVYSAIANHFDFDHGNKNKHNHEINNVYKYNLK